MKREITSWHVATAAEAIAAALFARCGYDVSVQYGANQPEYDLIVTRGAHTLKVSVKGSQDGSWVISPKRLTRGRADYHEAAEKWRRRHNPGTVLCFVQFKGVDIAAMPRAYLATPQEVAQRLCETANGRGDTILYEQKKWTARAHAAGRTDEIPSSWRFSKERVEALLRTDDAAASADLDVRRGP